MASPRVLARERALPGALQPGVEPGWQAHAQSRESGLEEPVQMSAAAAFSLCGKRAAGPQAPVLGGQDRARPGIQSC